MRRNMLRKGRTGEASTPFPEEIAESVGDVAEYVRAAMRLGTGKLLLRIGSIIVEQVLGGANMVCCVGTDYLIG